VPNREALQNKIITEFAKGNLVFTNINYNPFTMKVHSLMLIMIISLLLSNVAVFIPVIILNLALELNEILLTLLLIL